MEGGKREGGVKASSLFLARATNWRVAVSLIGQGDTVEYLLFDRCILCELAPQLHPGASKLWLS